MGKIKNQQNLKRKRKIERFELIQERYYIFCEGEQTEPRYFQSIKECIDENPVYKNMIKIEIEGCGAETLRVIKAAEDYITVNKVKEGQIWLVYDKDSFPAERFNGVSERAKSLNKNNTKITYNVAWSNECVEYWFVLHFAYYSSNNDRKYYRAFLDKKFSELKLPRYEKKDIFDILLNYGDPKMAIRYAKKQIEENLGKTDAEIVPATKIYLLVEELAKYFPEDIKNKYI